MIKSETSAALERIRRMNNNKDSDEFKAFAAEFEKKLASDLSRDKINTQILIDYIKELDEKER